MISPLRTKVTNLTDHSLVILGDKLRLILSKNGTDGACSEVVGDIFCLAESSRYIYDIINMMIGGLIDVSYIVEDAFNTEKTERNLLTINEDLHNKLVYKKGNHVKNDLVAETEPVVEEPVAVEVKEEVKEETAVLVDDPVVEKVEEAVVEKTEPVAEPEVKEEAVEAKEEVKAPAEEEKPVKKTTRKIKVN